MWIIFLLSTLLGCKKINTKLDCKQLFLTLKNIEHKMGRNFYSPRNFPRIIDIDILTFNNDIIKNSMYTIPHKSLHKRKFVLKPWNEIAPKFNVPGYDSNVSMLLNDTKDISLICKLDNNIK